MSKVENLESLGRREGGIHDDSLGIILRFRVYLIGTSQVHYLTPTFESCHSSHADWIWWIDILAKVK